jgi:hypothetical protein
LARRSKRIVAILFSTIFFVFVILLRSSETSGTTGVRRPMFEDWSTRHLVYPHFGYLRDLEAVERDPRAIFQWWKRTESEPFRRRHRLPFPVPRRPQTSMHRDWSIYLGTAGTANGMYPAKFTFNATAAPSCENDYVVFPIAAAGSSTQPNIVAFNNLYSGTAGGNGICNRTPSGSDTGVAATVIWSYNVQALTGGAVTTSPVISYDPGGVEYGTKVAFVESAAGSPAHFHVLAFKAQDGQNSGNLQSVLTPKTINTFVTSAPVNSSGTATDLALGSSTSGTDTLSSPFVDYTTDKAYVGNDVGVLYRLKDVFCISTNADCAGTTKPAPSLDTTWGTGGAITVCSGRLTAPVLDYFTYNIFVGCSDGKLYCVSQAGTISSIVVGDGVASKTYGAIVDPPIVDSVNHFVYAVSGSANNGANGVLVQTTTTLSSSVAVPIGSGNQCNIHAPAMNNPYFTSPTTAGALIYIGGVTGTVAQPCTAASMGGTVFLYGATFGAAGVLTSGTPKYSFNGGGGPGAEWVPLEEFYNTTTSADWLLAGALQSNQTNMTSFPITSGFPAGFGVLVTEGIGQSGMVVDNNSSAAQAASLYFNALGENTSCNNNTVLTDTGGCAVKLTQASLE